MAGIREATADELLDWDAHTVDLPGGDVYQSRRLGSAPRGTGLAATIPRLRERVPAPSLERPWPLIGGGGAYISRGPVAAGEPVERTADRLREATAWLVARGVDVVSADAEIEASTGFGALIEARGFRPIEEIQPSRHRVALRLPPGATEEAAFMATASSVHQVVRHAERAGFRVVR